MELPIYKLTIRENDPNTGVEFVALVDDPAIKRNYHFFKAEKQLFQIQDEEKRVVSGPLMVADMPIFRKAGGKMKTDYYAVFDADTIWQIGQKFFKENKGASVNLMHQPDLKVNGVYCFESFFIDSKRGINTPTGFDTLSDGSWFGSFKVDNDAVWEEVKAGTFKGFSVEGMFEMELAETADEKLMNEVMAILEQMN